MILYIDPGSGSIIVQAIVVAFATVAVFFKNIKYFILGFFGKKDKESIDD